MSMIETFTQMQERQAPLLAFRRFTFNMGMETEPAARVLLDAAKSLGLVDRDHLYGNTLNAWLLPDGKPPMWAVRGAMHWLETHGWQPSSSSDMAWFAFCKSKSFDDYEEAAATIPSQWPDDVRQDAAGWLLQIMNIKRERQKQEKHDAL